MIRYILIFQLFIYSTCCLASVSIDLAFNNSEIKQGGLEKVSLVVDKASVGSFEIQKLKNQTLGKTIYFYQISPLMGKSGTDTYSADATVVFLKVPETNVLRDKVADTEISVRWPAVTIIPTEASQGFLFGQFSIPGKINYLVLFLILDGLVLLAYLFYRWYKKKKFQKALRNNRIKLKETVLGASDYEQVVGLWEIRKVLIAEFPHLDDPFKKLEIVLYKYQFKPEQTEADKNTVMRAYREFVSSVQGGFDGI